MILLVILALTTGVAVILGLMVVGLLEAPWPILLTLLLVGFYGLQRLTAHAAEWDNRLETSQTQPNTEPESADPSEAQEDDSQTFTYRGVKYRSQPSKQPTTDEPTITEGIYRGQHWQRSNTEFSKSEPLSSGQPTQLKYRGHNVKS